MKPGRLLIVVAVGHTLVGLIGYREVLADMLNAGLFNTVGSCIVNICGDVRPAATASFFLLMAPPLGVVGHLLDRVIDTRDASAVRVVGWMLLIIGLVGGPIAPLTPMWFLIPFGLWLFFLASRLSD